MAAKQPAGKSRGEKRKRVVLTLKEKIDVCARLERGESRKALMQEYNVGMSTLYDIKAHKAQLLRFFASSDCNKALEQRRTLHTPKLEHLDRVLYEWFLAKRAEGVPVSGPMLIEKAKDFYEQMRLTEPCVFSGGWLWRFKARHGIKKLDASSEKQVADHQAAEQFCGFFRSLVAEHGMSPEQFYNADETGLFWCCLPNPSPQGEPVAGLKQSKDRLTVLMCANAAGSHKIKPLVVGKCGGPRAFKGIQHLPVAYKAQGNAWVDKEIFSDWFHHIFVPSVKEHFRAVGLPEGSKAVLLLDDSRARPQESELVSENVSAVLLPASITSLLQPMDQGIRRAFMRNFINPPAALQDLHARHSAHDAVVNVACAWSAVGGEVLRRAWRKLWPAAVLAEGSSSEEEEQECVRAQPPRKAFVHIMELMEGSRALASPPCDKSEVAEWGEAEKEVGVARGAAAAEALAAVWSSEKVGAAGRDRGGAGAGEGAEAAWEKAATSFDSLVSFAERQPCFSTQELGQLRALHAVFVRQRLVRKHVALRAAVKAEKPQDCPGGYLAPTQGPVPSTSAAACGED
ncbi:jerky protein homolog [Dasypus novemcinctus]|uniref:jerky protein homolog n=1 Tax=Dasypus novemcinctus TaxID=9361 RepID=UPI0003292AC6|nr:jerky protein homolog [Dasypus novemcinctus]